MTVAPCGGQRRGRGILTGEMVGLLRIRDFRLLFVGEGVSLLGDQFYFIALPWLVLELSHDPFTLGAMLALQGLPRALFMLVGGAVTDRFSPRRVMIGSNVARCVLAALLAALVLSGSVRLWMLWSIVFAFGVADGFFFPAQSAIVPRLAATEQLPAANAVVQGLDQVAQFVGPMLAGALIAGFTAGRLGLQGVGLALAVDAATFVVSVATLWVMHVDRVSAAQEGGSVREGFAYMWGDGLLRTLLALIVAVNFLAVGPLLVGIPQLVRERLGEGAGAFGVVMSAFGAGSLAGLALGGTLPKPPPRVTGNLLLAVCAVFGAGLAILGFAHTLVGALLPALLMGLAVGYLMVSFFSWIQTRTPQRMMGRMMSLIIFASVGLVPLSQLVSGAVARRSVTALFVGAAILLGLVVVRAWFVPSLRAMGVEIAAGNDGDLALAEAAGPAGGASSDGRDAP